MTPRQFEELVSNYFRSKGYKTELTPYSGDYGVDVFAIKRKEKIAVQVKMYGGSTRKINRQMVMELHGAKDYFDCTGAIIATDGNLLLDAMQVAKKLGIEVLYMDSFSQPDQTSSKTGDETFDSIWEHYIIPLAGKTLTRSNGETNKILKVDWSGIERVSSNDNKGKIKIEIFKFTIKKLLREGFISRDEINQNYSGRASSGVVLILSQAPFFHKTSRPTGLRYVKDK